MPDNITWNNKKIAKNTLMLYLRMFITIPIGLYSSRLVLEALGVESYGVYNVIGGTVALFSIITGALSVSISRFLTYEMGKLDKSRLNTIFSTSINIQIVLSLIILIFAEVIGVWFLNTQMNIPSGKMFAANWVFQFTVVTFIIGLISIPYNALILAHERMSIFAYFGIFESLLKFLIAFILLNSKLDRLILYSILLMSVSFVIRIIYGIYCNKQFEESKYNFIIDKALITEMSKFIGWAFFGNGVVVLKEQGTVILLNIFGGPIVNAAQGVAMQVNGVVTLFVNNFLMAVHPQITKSYSAKELGNMHNLIIRSSKMSFFILLILFVPICLNIEYLLSIWLVEVPQFTSSFVILILITSLMQCFNQPILTGVLAEGNIKNYELSITIIYSMNFIINYFLLKKGLQPYYVYFINSIFIVLVLFVLLKQAKDKYKFPVLRFFSESFSKAVFIALLCLFISSYFRISMESPFLNIIISIVIQFIFTIIVIFFWGLNKDERMFIFSSIESKLNKFI